MFVRKMTTKIYLGIKIEAQYFLHEGHKTKNNHTCFGDQS